MTFEDQKNCGCSALVVTVDTPVAGDAGVSLLHDVLGVRRIGHTAADERAQSGTLFRDDRGSGEPQPTARLELTTVMSRAEKAFEAASARADQDCV